MGIEIQFLLAILLAGFCASWVYNDAKSRGINGFPWAFLTFLAVIIGLPMYLLLRPRGELVGCIWCNKKKLYSLSTCPYCNKTSGVQAEEAQNTVEGEIVSRGTCDFCGKIIDSGWKYCPYCGKEKKQ